MDYEFICNGRVGTGRGMILGEWGGAKLYASSQSIIIKAPLMGILEFTPKQVERFSIVGTIPYLTQGIKIHHVVNDYPPVIIFRAFRNPNEIIRKIHQEGFKCCGKESIECLDCGTILPENKNYCPKCGWSYRGGPPESS
jgi:hypothetical protein